MTLIALVASILALGMGAVPYRSVLAAPTSTERANEIAAAVANASVLDQIEELDLSGGTLTDEGSQPLLESPKIGQLKRLNLETNFLTDNQAQAFTALTPVDLNVNVDDQRDEEDYGRYVAVGE